MRRLLLLVPLFAACATSGPPITKLVGGRRIHTRSISPDAYEHVSRALLYEDEDRFEDAAAELQRALSWDGEAPELHAHLAEVFIRLDRASDAESEVRASLGIEATVDGLVAQAHVAQLRGDTAAGVAALERATHIAPFTDDTDQAERAYLELGEAALLALDPERARRAYHDLCEGLSGSLAGRLRLAAVAWAMGDLREAERRLRETVAEEPNQLEALLQLAALQAATGRNDEALRTYRDALDRSEGAAEVASAFARFLVATGRPREAEQIAEDLGPFDPRDEEEFGKRLEVERAARRWDHALAQLRAAAQAQGDAAPGVKARLPLYEAQIFADQGKKAEAAARLLAVPRSADAYVEARLRAAELLREDGRAAEAARALDAVAPEGERGEIEVAVARALTEERLGDPARAVRRLEEALGKHKDNVRLTMTLATVEDRRGQWRRALTVVEPILRRDPGSVEALNFWGFVAADHGHELPLATRRLQVALARDTATGSIIDSVGWAHLRAGDVVRAALFLEQAARLEPDDAEILSHVGELYARRAENARAVAAFRRALTLRPEEALRRRLEDALARLEARKAARP